MNIIKNILLISYIWLERNSEQTLVTEAYYFYFSWYLSYFLYVGLQIFYMEQLNNI